jgi:hypothetical protein
MSIKTVCVDGLNEKCAVYRPHSTYEELCDMVHKADCPKLKLVDLFKFTTDDGITHDYYLYNHVINGRWPDSFLVFLFHASRQLSKDDVWSVQLPWDVAHDLDFSVGEPYIVTVQLYEIGNEQNGALFTFQTKLYRHPNISSWLMFDIPRSIVIDLPFPHITVCVAVTNGHDDCEEDFIYTSCIGQHDLFRVVDALSGKW